jgi:hypothetical protein
MATVNQEQREDGPTLGAPEPTRSVESDCDPSDFELDESLRKLRLDEWFAIAEEGAPIWVF